MDRLLKSPWFVKVIAFLFALTLYTVVGMEENEASNGIFPELDETETFSTEVDVVEKYNEEEFILTGLPDKVDVRFEGNKSAINRFKLQRTPEVVVNMEDYKAGDYNIKLEMSDLPDDIQAFFPNNNVKVTLHQKVTKTFSVQVELMNSNELPNGYVAGNPEFQTAEVSITGAKEIVDTISYVKGFVDVKGAKEKVIRDVELKAYNEGMGQVQIAVIPNTIQVTVPITNPSKEIKLEIEQVNQLPEGLELKSIVPNKETVTIFGPQDVLDKLDTLQVEVDLATIEEDKELNVKLKMPEGTIRIDPEEVKVTIDVEQKEDIEITTFESIPISINGLPENFKATFITPKDGTFSIVVKGSKDDLKNLSLEDISAIVNLENFSKGEHSVEIQVKGPEKFIYQQSSKEALLSIEEETTRS